MARPLDHEKRLGIARAALAVLKERGLAEARMAHIAAELGMKRSTLYHYFGSLPELYAFALEQIHNEEAAHVAQRLAGASHPLDALYTAMRASYDFHAASDLESYVVLLCQGWSGTAADRQAFRRVSAQRLEPVRQLLIGALQLGMAQGQVAPCDPAAITDLCLAALNGALVLSALRGGSVHDALEQLRISVLEPLRRGEACPPPQT